MTISSRASMTGLAAFLLTLIGSTAQASPPGTLALTPADSGEFGNGGTIGGWGWAFSGVDYQFHVTAPTQVTALAYYQLPVAVPLKRSIVVSIEQVSPNAPAEVVASTVIGPANLVDHVSINVDFLYCEIEPVTLVPGSVYQITETFVPTEDPINNSFFYAVNAVFPDPNVALDGSCRFGGNFYSTPSLFGDLNGDGFVDSADVGLLLLDFGPCGGCPSDLDGDGNVDGADIGLLLLNFT